MTDTLTQEQVDYIVELAESGNGWREATCIAGNLSVPLNAALIEQEQSWRSTTSLVRVRLNPAGLTIAAQAKQLRERDARIAELESALKDIESNYDHEHHSLGLVNAGDCDGPSFCRRCTAKKALGERSES